MANFYGTAENDVANAAMSQVAGFTGGSVAELNDGVGDFFTGVEGEDFVFAGDGNDVIEGGEGHDTLNGGAGNDQIAGYIPGADSNGSLIGDEIVGNDGNDNLIGSGGNDVIDGGDDDDDIRGGGGNDLLAGGSGQDRFFFLPNEVLPGEIIDGGFGFDEIRVTSGNVTFTNASIAGIEVVTLENDFSTATFTASQVKTGLSASLSIAGISSNVTFRIEMGAETVLDVAGFTFLSNWDGNDRVVVVGDADEEFMAGTTQKDRLFGNGGDDTLNGAGGVDQLFGGLGNDVYLVDQAGGEAVEVAGQGTDSVFAPVSHTLAANVENLTLVGVGNLNGIGNTLANTITGGNGNNILNGGAGADVLQGLGGNDSYAVDSAADTIFETTGTDNVNASVSYTLAAGVAVETLRTTNAAGTAAINLTGNNLANIVIGNAGANNLNGGGGPDTMQGLAGNDIYVVDNVSDKAIEAVSAGIDRVNSTVSFTLGANVENLTLTGVAAISGAGNTLANIIIGNSANNTLSGGTGVDSLRGGLGNDSYIVDHVSDQVVESAGAGTDRIVSSVTEVLALNVENLTLTGSAAINGTGNTLNNLIIGNAANNILSGSSGIDALHGGTGNDILIGGAGKDAMTGGAGADDFDFNSIAEIGNGATRDIIRDFVHLTDDIDLSTIDANGGAIGNTAFSFLAAHSAAFTGAAGQLHWFRQDLAGTANDRTIVEGDINGNKVADFQIQLTGLKTLSSGDFVL